MPRKELRNKKRIKLKLNNLKQEKENESNLMLESILKYISPEIKYNKFKYKNIIYSVGDGIVIKKKSQFIIAKICKIIPINGILKFRYWPSKEVQ